MKSNSGWEGVLATEEDSNIQHLIAMMFKGMMFKEQCLRLSCAVLSNEVNLLRYSTWVAFFDIYFLRSGFLQTTFYL